MNVNVNKRLTSMIVVPTVLSTALGAATVVQAEDWPTFRGTDRTAISSESNLIEQWESDGPNLVWSAKGAGRGYASPAVADGRIYTLGDGPSTADDQEEYLTCFDEQTGEQLWMQRTGPAWNSGRDSWQGSRSTPTIDGGRVYVTTPFGKLICASIDDGTIQWQVDLKEDLGGEKKDGWGYSESPLVDGDLLICTPGGEEATMVALNKATGEPVWTCQRPGDVGAGHSSVVISHVGGQKIYVQNTGGGPMGVAADSGKLLWSYDMDPPTAFIPTAIIKDDLVFSVGGYNLGGALLRQVPGNDGAVSIKEIYGPNPDVANKHGGVILIGDYLYGGKEDRNIVYCADLMTGELKWEERGSGSGSTSVIAGDGKLYIRFQNGIVALAEVTPNQYREISTFKTPGSGDSKKPSWAHPVIANGKLLLREDDTILCYDISE